MALFDIPDPWPNGSISFPDDFSVVVEQDGIPTFGGNQVTVLDSGGSPMVFSAATPLSRLELAPMLRLRPTWDGETGEGFDPSWEIGGVEFTLRYTPGAGEVSDLTALATGEATAGLAMATGLIPEGGDKLWRIVLIHPPGFELPEMGCTGGGECFSGRWALLDVSLDVDDSGLPDGELAFVPADFGIEDLRVVDRDGVQLTSVGSGEEFFHTCAANNVVPVPEPGLLLLLTSGCLGLLVLNRLERCRRARVPRSPR